MSLFLVLPAEAPEMVGNWHPFPPPEKGIYDLRRVQRVVPEMRFQYFPNKRVYEGGSSRLLCMGRRVTRMRADDGWQFRFLQQYVDHAPVNWRPMAVIYEFALAEGSALAGVVPRVVEKRDITGQLPLARSVEEARYIVRSIPDRYPVFRGIHVEFTEERLQS